MVQNDSKSSQMEMAEASRGRPKQAEASQGKPNENLRGMVSTAEKW